jgi:hypothetical protein
MVVLKLKDVVQKQGGKDVQLPRWFRIEQEFSARIDGRL